MEIEPAWLSLFISSRMGELADERRLLQNSLMEFHWHGWLWETDAGARDASIRTTYLAEVAACDIYIGLFWRGYGAYTIEEFQEAVRRNKPILLYVKQTDAAERDPELTRFLDSQQQADSPNSRTVFWFQTASQLVTQVKHDVLTFLLTALRQDHYPARPRIANILAHTGGPDMLSLLGDVYKREQDATRRTWVALSIALMQTPAAKKALLALLTWETQFSQSRIERQIAERGIEKALKFFKD